MKELLPALDSFDRAVSSAGENCDKPLLEGVQLVQRQLLDALKKLGLEEVEACGQFDPNLHEAVLREKAEARPAGTSSRCSKKDTASEKKFCGTPWLKSRNNLLAGLSGTHKAN
jgi:molecular chaperone GrpE (heat shock protein)